MRVRKSQLFASQSMKLPRSPTQRSVPLCSRAQPRHTFGVGFWPVIAESWLKYLCWPQLPASVQPEVDHSTSGEPLRGLVNKLVLLWRCMVHSSPAQRKTGLVRGSKVPNLHRPHVHRTQVH